ncbi:ABC transporter ATP-binding protein/permease [Salidesulfovibrio onnuriiensis]|uniref:ABC transporter ATP-binding protein/permease n=1 Tax=Salidesulfovibrio onnuriiensis TaxID=2583823 RepID=UPI0011CA3AE7|nr:ABC transporter ATP-binding protein/permease [Salidesulfovibrio onnuriiensis]
MPTTPKDIPVTKKSIYSWVFYKNTNLQILVVAIILVTVAMRLLPLEMSKRIINEAVGMKDLHKLYLYCGVYLVSVVLASVLKMAINLLQNFMGERTLKNLREKLYAHALSLPLSYYRKTSPGQVISYMITELIPVANFIGSAVAVPAVNLLTFAAYFIYLFYLNPYLSIIAVGIYTMEVMVIPPIQKRFNKANRERIDYTQRVSGLIGESISGVHEVHANASIPLESRRYRKALENLYKSTLVQNAYKYGIKFSNNFFQSLGPFSLLLIGGYLTIKGRFDLGALFAFQAAYDKLYQPWKDLMEFWQIYIDSSVRYRQVMDSFDIEPDHELEARGRDPYHLDGNIDVKDLSYVVGSNIKLLDNVSLNIAEGEHVALVGFSGSGKSTLALCIAQLYKYTGGSVQIGGREVAELSKQDMTHNLGMVAQHPFIFNGTVQDNLLYSCDALTLQGGSCTAGKGEPSLDKVIEVVQQMGLFLDVLSFGLRSVIDPDKHPELAEAIIHARSAFSEEHGRDLAGDIEIFHMDRYAYYSNVAANITTGAPLKEEYLLASLYDRPFFRDFLEKQGLMAPLLQLGADMTRRVVDIFSSVGDLGEELFQESPIRQEDFETYKAIADHLDRGREPTEVENSLLLKLALDCAPGMHKLGSMTDELARRVLKARKAFRELMEHRDPEAFAFLDAKKYMRERSIQDNIVFGRVKPDSAGAEERINQSIMQLLIMEGVLEQVVEMGLQFEVGSMGDRLSGGQRQKIALARVFLKSPRIVILDEATAALDNASQKRVQNVISRKWKGTHTVVAVIHRLDMLVHYDKVAVLKAGKIIEQGTYDELIERRGALHELVYGKQ